LQIRVGRFDSGPRLHPLPSHVRYWLSPELQGASRPFAAKELAALA
jgi:hypothetical protein